MKQWMILLHKCSKEGIPCPLSFAYSNFDKAAKAVIITKVFT